MKHHVILTALPVIVAIAFGCFIGQMLDYSEGSGAISFLVGVIGGIWSMNIWMSKR